MATRSSNSFMSWPSITTSPQAPQRSAGSCAVKVWPQTSMLSSSAMATTFSLSHREQVFIPPPTPPAWPLPERCEHAFQRASPAGTAACTIERSSNAQRDDGGTVRLVDPRVGPALHPLQAAVEQVLGHDVAHGREQRLTHAGGLALQLAQQRLHAPARAVRPRPPQTAR